ncbi:hypothetical protein J5690_08025 [bacterium]|nr:hypothetical protein [bacterium]
MKKFFVCSAVMAAMVLMVGCGGSDGGSNSGGYGDGSYGGGSSSGSYEGSGSSSSSSSSECDNGDRKCSDYGSNFSWYCSNGRWDVTYEYCSDGCNSSTGRCNSSSGGGSSSECDYGDYKCDGNSSYRCSGGSWSYDEYCSNGCSYSTGKCNSSSGSSSSSSEHSPCPPKLSGSVSGSSVKLSWSYSTSSGCGTPTTATLKYYNDSYGSWEEVKSSSASSFKSYTLSVSTYGYYDSNAGQTLLKAGVLVENEAGSDSASCYCFIDDKNCSCY